MTTDQINAAAWDEGNRSANRRAGTHSAWPKWTAGDYNVAARKANELFAHQIGAKSASDEDVLARLNELAAEEVAA